MLLELHVWLERFQHDLGVLRRELNHFCPWLNFLSAPPSGCEELSRQLIDTLSPLALPSKVAYHADFAQRLIKHKLQSAEDHSEAKMWLMSLASALR